MNIYEHLTRLYAIDSKKDFLILGKGETVNEINLSSLNNYFIVNLNDSEVIYPGSVALISDSSRIKLFDRENLKCSLYITSYDFPVYMCILTKVCN